MSTQEVQCEPSSEALEPMRKRPIFFCRLVREMVDSEILLYETRGSSNKMWQDELLSGWKSLSAQWASLSSVGPGSHCQAAKVGLFSMEQLSDFSFTLSAPNPLSSVSVVCNASFLSLFHTAIKTVQLRLLKLNILFFPRPQEVPLHLRNPNCLLLTFRFLWKHWCHHTG